MKIRPIKLISLVFGLATVAIAAQSCSDDDDKYDISTYYPNAVVTVKTASDSTTYLQLDDNTTLLPTNVKGRLFGGKEVRALTNISSSNANPGKYNKAVTINWIDSIRTKTTVATLGNDDDNKKAFGNDPIEIVKDWYVIAEDGYLTLRIRTLWGYGKTHSLNLLTGVNSDNAYELELRHNANGDNGQKIGDSLIAFRLDSLPDTNGKTVKLKLNWNSFSGKKSAEFDFCSRKVTTSGTLQLSDTQYLSAID